MAFSESGHFDANGPFSQLELSSQINKINGKWVENSDTVSLSLEFFEGMQEVKPMLVAGLGLFAPWNKFLTGEKTGCSVCCVTTAMVTAILHSKNNFIYNGNYYDFEGIRNALSKNGHNPHKKIGDIGISNPKDSLSKSDSIVKRHIEYNEAVDSVAKLLTYIGSDIEVDYTTGTAWDYKGYNWLLEHEFPLTGMTYYLSHSLSRARDFLQDRNLLILHSDLYRNDDYRGGHLMLIDGCRYWEFEGEIDKDMFYLSCDFGWDGDYNGYYRWDFFKTGEEEGWKPSGYRAIKIK